MRELKKSQAGEGGDTERGSRRRGGAGREGRTMRSRGEGQSGKRELDRQGVTEWKVS